MIAFPHRSSTTLAHLGSRFGSLAELSLLIRCNFLERRLGPMYELSTIRSACRAGERAFMQGFRRHCGMSSTARVPLHEFRKRSGHFSAGVGQGRLTPALPHAPIPLNPSLYSLSNGCRSIAGRIVTGKPFGQAPFQAHVELLRLFLTHREDIVESIEAVLNAQRKPTRYLQDRSLLSRQFEDCFFARTAVTASQAHLRGQLEEAHWAAGFKPRQVHYLHNDLIHPAEMMIRGIHCWQQTRWPGRSGRMHYAHTLFNLYVIRCLQFLSMRLWDEDRRRGRRTAHRNSRRAR